MATNECIPFKEPGKDVTAQATAAVTGKRFLAISGNILADGSLSVAHAGAGARVVGVSKYDAASGAKVGVIRGAKVVVPVECAANLTAGQEVESDAQGRAIVLASGKPAGYAETAATSGQAARICLF